METILEYVKSVEGENKNVSYVDAEESGFTMIAKGMKAIGNGYITISKVRIGDYLKKLAVCYDRYLQTDGDSIYIYIPAVWGGIFGMSCIKDSYTLIWREILVEDYDKVPPNYVFEKLKIARLKNIFDYFTVASIKEVKDPLLLGRIKGDTNRYFIAQWDNDLRLDDL